MMIKKFERIISITQSKFRAIIEKKNITQQCSYNLPNDIESYLKGVNALKRITPTGNETYVIYEINDDYSIILGDSILAIIGNEYQKEHNKVVFTHTEGADGSTPKIQLKKTDFASRGNEYKWFVELYEKNIESLNFVTYVDDDNKTIKFDVELSSKLFVNDNEEEIDYDNCKRIQTGNNIILYGVPGAGKSYTIENEYSDENTKKERVVFYPDYTYSDFVGQILPKSENGDVTYQFIPGPFTRIVNEAYHNPMKKFILVIEEINRGNAPSIFGDIFQLLDRDGKKEIKDKDGNLIPNKNYCASSYGIRNADVAKIVYGDENHEVKIPSNMSIICTMNTSDQNIFTLDTAFQRRWNMRLIENKFRDGDEKFAKTTILDSNVTWQTFCETMNSLILENNNSMISSEDKRLGTHFVTMEELMEDDDKIKNRRFPEKVIKYLWDDAFKLSREEIFNEKYKSLEDLIKKFVEGQKDDKFDVFNENIKGKIIKAKSGDGNE